MIRRLSIHELLASLPVATVIFTSDGQIVAAGDSFWKLCGMSAPVTSLNRLNALGSTLKNIADSTEITAGHYIWKGTLGHLYITWRRSNTESGPIIVACLSKDDMSMSDSHPIEQTVPSGRDLPDPAATLTLLERAYSTCSKTKSPICVARIGVYTADKCNLSQTDREAWRSVGRKLRATCRMSDLLGVNASGDFLIILVNTKQQEAMVAMHRVLRQLSTWVTASLAWPVQITTGYASCIPSSSKTAQDLLAQASIDQELPSA